MPCVRKHQFDIPALGADIYSVFNKDDGRYIIFDVGGDDAGAAALGRYSHLIQQEEFDMLYVVNCYRYLTRHPQEALEILREIETTARIPVTGIVNNSNLGSQTTIQDITNAIGIRRGGGRPGRRSHNRKRSTAGPCSFIDRKTGLSGRYLRPSPMGKIKEWCQSTVYRFFVSQRVRRIAMAKVTISENGLAKAAAFAQRYARKKSSF